jgi:hypothetical protein
LFWAVSVVARTLDHDHADKGANDGEEDEDEDDGDLDCPFAGRKEIVQRMVLVDEGLGNTISVHSILEGQEPQGRSGGLIPWR